MTNAGALLVITIGPAITITLGATLLMYGWRGGQGCQRLSCPGAEEGHPIKGTVGEIIFQS
jgi:hypothetical protein